MHFYPEKPQGQCPAGAGARFTWNGGWCAVGEKRLTVTFPAGHPVWSYPRGQQSARVREWVDIALGLADILEGIRSELEALRKNSRSGADSEVVERGDGFSDFVRAFER